MNWTESIECGCGGGSLVLNPVLDVDSNVNSGEGESFVHMRMKGEVATDLGRDGWPSCCA